MTDKMLSRVDAGIGFLTINNPERRNAVSIEMAQRGAEIVTELSADTAVRAIVIEGAGGKAWMSGADIGDFNKQKPPGEGGKRPDGFGFYDAVYNASKPVIATIQGYCMGGGVALACACDLRIAATDAVFAVPAGRLGIAYPPHFTRWMMETVGIPNTKEMLFSGRRYTAEDARDIGLVNRVVAPAELATFTLEYVRAIADSAPLSLSANKRIVREVAKGLAVWDEALCKSLADSCRNSDDFAEGRKAFAEKRKPVFVGR